jgi:hypothetical protein
MAIGVALKKVVRIVLAVAADVKSSRSGWKTAKWLGFRKKPQGKKLNLSLYSDEGNVKSCSLAFWSSNLKGSV